MFPSKLFALVAFFALAVISEGVTIPNETVVPSYVLEWESELKTLIHSKGMRLVPGISIGSLLSTQIALEDFENTCASLLETVVEESSETKDSFTNIDFDSAFELCVVINPWNSVECSGLIGAAASLALEIRNYVGSRNNRKGDLRAACLIASSVAPGRPFGPLKKGSIKSGCIDVCSGHPSISISKIDPSFCSMKSDLCKSIDFTLSPTFSNLTDKEFGIGSSVAVLLSEGALGLKTSYIDGCNFVSSLTKKGALSASSGSISASVLQSEILEFFRTKLNEVGISIYQTSDGEDPASNRALIMVIATQIADAAKSVFLDHTKETKEMTSISLPSRAKQILKKPKTSIITNSVSSSQTINDSQSYDSSLENISSIISDSSFVNKYMDTSIKLSAVQSDWYNTIFDNIRRTKEKDEAFNAALTRAVSKFDGSNVYASCVSVLRKSGLASNRKISTACRKIDPFSDVRCQRLNHFELVYLTKLRDDLETVSRRIPVVDLRDLCALANRMSLRSFIRENSEEISHKCVRALKSTTFAKKYSLSDRAIKKACIRSDYIRSSACREIVVSPQPERIQSVLDISNNLFLRRNDRDRLRIIRANPLDSPTYVDICNLAYRVETTEECVMGFREVISRYAAVAPLMDIEGACFSAFGTIGIYGPQRELSYGPGPYPTVPHELSYGPGPYPTVPHELSYGPGPYPTVPHELSYGPGPYPAVPGVRQYFGPYDAQSLSLLPPYRPGPYMKTFRRYDTLTYPKGYIQRQSSLGLSHPPRYFTPRYGYPCYDVNGKFVGGWGCTYITPGGVQISVDGSGSGNDGTDKVKIFKDAQTQTE